MSNEHHAADPKPVPLPSMAEVFAKRPALYMGGPVTYERVLTFISGFSFAITLVHFEIGQNGTAPVGPETEFKEHLREEGRLRWDSWELTLLAEAIGWTSEEPPNSADLTDGQQITAIEALVPLLELVFGQVGEIAGLVLREGQENHA